MTIAVNRSRDFLVKVPYEPEPTALCPELNQLIDWTGPKNRANFQSIYTDCINLDLENLKERYTRSYIVATIVNGFMLKFEIEEKYQSSNIKTMKT